MLPHSFAYVFLVRPPPLIMDAFLDFWQHPFNRNAFLALVLVSFCCGAVGSLVVGSRMAFFSDALAHCAFAGISIGFLSFDLLVRHFLSGQEFWDWATPIMVAFGVLVGCGIVAVRTRSGLSSDTVIGVFFAGCLGLAAFLQKIFQNRNLFNLEDFLFGNPFLVKQFDLLVLAGMAVLTVVVLALIYNYLLIANFNSSLAQSRRVPVHWCNYLFVALLAVVVNLGLRAVGALLINALLIVPAASAMNVSRNLRQLFWMTIFQCVFVSVGGLWLSTNLENYFESKVRFGVAGTIVILSVLLFMLSLAVGPLVRGRQAASAG